MKLLVLALFLSVGVLAHASSDGEYSTPFLTTVGPSVSTFFTTYCTDSPVCKNKMILENAKDDAAIFVSTDGKTRGAKLEQALVYVHEVNPANMDSDMVIAHKILADQF